jgi:hypothetical protein
MPPKDEIDRPPWWEAKDDSNAIVARLWNGPLALPVPFGAWRDSDWPDRPHP